MQSPDPGISLATLFSGRTPATPAAAMPKKADGPKFEESLSQASDRTDAVKRSDRPSGADHWVSDERPDDRASSYARAKLLISEPVAKAQELTEVVPTVAPQPVVDGDQNLVPVDIELSNPERPDTEPDSEDLIFQIQPWPLDSTADDAYLVQPAVAEKPVSVESIQLPTELPQSADITSDLVAVEPEVVTPHADPLPEAGSFQIEPQIELVVATHSEPVRPIPPNSSPQPQPTEQGVTTDPVVSSQPDALPQDALTAAASVEPAIEKLVASEATPDAQAARTEAENFEDLEPAGRAAVNTSGESSFANAPEAAVQAAPAPSVEPRSSSLARPNVVREVTGTSRRVLDGALSAAGVAVAAVEDAGENTSSGSGTQDFDGQSFSSLLQTQITQASRSRRASRPLEVGPTQFAEMPGEIVARARTLADNETTELEIQLDPPELGQLKIQLRRTDGEVAARITVTDPAAFELLQHELQDLRENLQQSDVAFGSVVVEQDQQQNQHAFDREQHDRHPREDVEPASGEPPASPSTSAHQTIDIRV